RRLARSYAFSLIRLLRTGYVTVTVWVALFVTYGYGYLYTRNVRKRRNGANPSIFGTRPRRTIDFPFVVPNPGFSGWTGGHANLHVSWSRARPDEPVRTTRRR